ncbi:MAG TPA: hypothetical protein VLJ21_01345 [Candidatus Binatia bacterium]|nr:hypothetical protein [Candidatus Binatia bacterium]
MLSFLKKLIRKTEPPQGEAVAVDMLESWLAQKLAAARQLAQQQLDAKRPAMREQLGAIASSIAALQHAQLMNPNIPERAKQVMGGNRDAFVRGIEQFVHSLTIPELDGVPAFQQQFRESLQSTLLAVNRPFQVLQEFFSHEAKDVLNRIHEFERQVLELGACRAPIDSLNAVGLAIDALVVARLRKNQAREQSHVARSDLACAEKELAETQSRIRALESSPEHQLLMDLKAKLEQNTVAKRQLRAGISEQFSALEPALKKYEHMTLHHQQLIRDYLANPVETLARDRDLVILHILRAMRKEVEADRIDLKDRRKEKVIAMMDALTPEALSGFLKQYGALTQLQERLIAEADKLDVLHRLAGERKQAESLIAQKADAERRQREAEVSAASDFSSEKTAIVAVAQERLGVALQIVEK